MASLQFHKPPLRHAGQPDFDRSNSVPDHVDIRGFHRRNRYLFCWR